MTDLKKIAADLHEVCTHLNAYGWPQRIREIADALDALASAEPVGWRYLTPGGLINMGLGPAPDNYDRKHLTFLYAAPQPAPAPVDPAELEALRNKPTDWPEWDGTDGAHPAFWRGQDDGVRGACMRIAEALNDPMPKPGVMREPLESLYRQIEALRRDAARWQKIETLWFLGDVTLTTDEDAQFIVHVDPAEHASQAWTGIDQCAAIDAALAPDGESE